MSYRNNATTEEQLAFAERLKLFRRRHGLTQGELAAAVGIRRATITDLENCEEHPFPETVLKFRQLEEKYEKAEELEMDSLEGMS